MGGSKGNVFFIGHILVFALGPYELGFTNDPWKALEDSFSAPIPFSTQPMTALLVAIPSIPIGESCNALRAVVAAGYLQPLNIASVSLP